jgi:hypothetical protein
MNNAQIVSIFKQSGKKTSKTNLLNSANICLSLQPTIEEKSRIKFSSTGTYDENTNLREIDTYVKDYFAQNKNRITEKSDKIAQLHNYIDTNKLTIVEKKAILNQIKTLEKEIHQLSSDDKFNEYKNASEPLLKEWDECLIRESSNKFFGSAKIIVPEKLNFVHRYIQLASKYSNLNLTYEKLTKKDHCPYCQQKYIVDEENEKKFMCEPCGVYF